MPFDLGRFDDYIDAYQIMDAWRASHAFPLNTIQMTLRHRAKAVDPQSEIVQRLKRAPSVIAKLVRYQDMQLSRMQDLGGSRAIVNSVDSARLIREKYRKSRDRHDLATEKDYIETPQASGYRGIHLIYRYQSDRAHNYNGHRIEVQLRTRVQHAWATAVEIAGIYVRTPLKSSIGPAEWLEYFRYVSSAFSIFEDTPRLHADLSKQQVAERIFALDRKLEARKKLRNFSAAHNYIAQNKRKSDSHFILILDLKQQRTSIESFSSISNASLRYAELEKTHMNDELTDVVLVAAENVESVTAAYPNYFADTRQFLELVDRVVPGTGNE
ncbi:RelA/SpoT domain-containing protein [Neotabrizicola shimadae]|uniref:RelA/SpoT domain-containing protein n=1 Tax=Neotabrizicola shimadae TaxID=2807096 RepID=A0A8G0ZUL2_9RHOB|nr:RelA/SpoT domain-containing protein [Neotabrizicola shimadae]QYZ70352.1 RelA/SpoT domain-containing protein [Neotabrizicola shimadae]